MVTCEVIEVKEAGIEVKIVGTDLTAFIRRADLARDRGEQRPERFAVGQKVDARVTQFDRKTHKVAVSIKALEVAEEKEAMAQYGSADSRRFARRHPGRRAQAARRQGRRQGRDRKGRGLRPRSLILAQRKRPPGPAPGVFLAP